MGSAGEPEMPFCFFLFLVSPFRRVYTVVTSEGGNNMGNAGQCPSELSVFPSMDKGVSSVDMGHDRVFRISLGSVSGWGDLADAGQRRTSTTT